MLHSGPFFVCRETRSYILLLHFNVRCNDRVCVYAVITMFVYVVFLCCVCYG